MNAVADTLDEARALIERGWRQKRFSSRDGRVCAVGAINKVVGGNASRIPQQLDWDDAYGFLKSATGGDVVTDWNDAPERTQAEVVEAFRKAAELARAASADTLPKGRDAKQGSVRSKGSAVPSEASADAQPNSSSNDSERQS